MDDMLCPKWASQQQTDSDYHRIRKRESRPDPLTRMHCVIHIHQSGNLLKIYTCSLCASSALRLHIRQRYIA
jgi:hypothetical protein